MFNRVYISLMQLKIMNNDFISKVVDRVFEMKKITLYLILIFILGFFLRLIAAINLSVSADDMHFVSHAINFLKADRLVTYDQSSGLWFAFTDIMYRLFGMTQLTSRIASLLFGSFSILIIYLLSREFFSEKVSFIAAFLLAIAPFHTRSTIAEMDAMVMFFVLLSMLVFVRALKTSKNYYYILSGIFIGLGIYTKVYPLLFIPSLLLYFVYFNFKAGKEIVTKENIKKVAIFLVTVFIFTIPAIAHNSLLYKDKGFLDLQFTRVFGLGKDVSAQYYAWDGQFDNPNSWKGLILGDTKHIASGKPLLLGAIDFIRAGDPVNFYLGLLGIALILFYRKEYRNYLLLFFLSILFALPYLASSILLPKHYMFLEILLIPIGALAIREMNGKIFKVLKKDFLKVILAIILLSSFIFLGLPHMGTQPNFYSKSYVAQVIDFKNKEISENSLIVQDSRIYRGDVHWTSQGRPYLEGSQFIELINKQDELPGNVIQADVFYFECVIDDCGWGTVANQPEFNASMESLMDFFKQNGQLIRTIKEQDKEKSYFPIFSNNKREIIRIYSAKLTLKDSILAFANQPKNWFLYDIGYQPVEKQFDYYETHGFIDKGLDKIAHWVVLMALILAFLSPVYVLYLLSKR